MQLFVIPPWVNATVGFSAPAVVLWAGGWRERTLAAIVLLAFVPVGPLYIGYYWGWPMWQIPQWFYWTADFLELSVCLGFALTSNRYWTIFASGACLLGPATRIVKLCVPSVTPRAYQSAQLIWWYLFLAILVGGAWESRRAGAHARPAAAPSRVARSSASSRS